MKERKNIDRLFQEKFKDFEAHPSEKVWSAIHAELQGEQTRKSWMDSVWSRVAGIAAALAIFFLVGDWFSINPSSEVATQKKEMQDRPEQEPFRTQHTAVAVTQQPEHELIVERMPAPAIVPKEIPLKVVHNASSIQKFGIKPYQSVAAILIDPFETEEYPETKPSDLEIASVSIFDAINYKQEGIELQELGKGKLIVTTKAAPIFYGNLGKGNFLDAKFDSNPNEGEVTFAYGINIAYAISDKIKLRSGINKVSMSYNTSDVPYRTAMDPSAISSISYNPNIKARAVSASVKDAQYMSATAARRHTGNLNTSSLNQKMGYIEIPVELQYNLLNKKIEINIIGGGSTLFLDQNVITLETGQEQTQLGKANNLNTVSFSTNIGVGVDYSLTDKFKLNLEPMFKYQLNTFSSDAGMYQPFFLGIYSGFSFEF